MPSLHRYKCLNPDCHGLERRDWSGLFSVMNAPTPVCPRCGSMKLDDWGETDHPPGWILSKPASFGNAGCAKRIDGKLQTLADTHGLTDISNRDGQPAKMAKTAAPGEQGKYGNISIAGVSAPVNDTPTGAWGSTGYTPFAVKTQHKFPGKKNIPTQVHAEHKGAIPT